MQRTIYAKTEKGLDPLLRVITTLRRKMFDVQDVALTTNAHGGNLIIILNEHPEKNGDLAIGYLKQLYEITEIKLV